MNHLCSVECGGGGGDGCGRGARGGRGGGSGEEALRVYVCVVGACEPVCVCVCMCVYVCFGELSQLHDCLSLFVLNFKFSLFSQLPMHPLLFGSFHDYIIV